MGENQAATEGKMEPEAHRQSCCDRIAHTAGSSTENDGQRNGEASKADNGIGCTE